MIGAFLVIFLIAPTVSAVEKRVALIIGNSAYADAPLRNPVNDARAMASVLRELDFDVTLLENADRTRMQRAALEFGRKLNQDAVGLFYFSGHGMQVRGVNYLIPVQAQVGTEEEVEVEAMDVNYVLARMAVAKNRFNIVILDACRNNPFERSFRSSTNGLAAISAPRGTLIAYATAPGSVAADGQGTNGLYTGELVNALKMANLPLEQTFKYARAEVVTKSSGKQTPWESSSVIGDFIFRPQAVAPVVSAADATFWSAVKDSGNPADYETYLKNFPQGFYASLAQSRINILTSVRETEISRVARDAADKAAREALLQAQRREAEAAKDSQTAQAKITTATAPVQTASLSSAPVSTVNRQAPGVEMKSNWKAIEQAVRTHFDDPENKWFYASHIQVMTSYPLRVNVVNYYDPVSVTDTGDIEAVFVLHGSYPFPRNIYTGGLQPFSIYVRYAVQQQAGGYTVKEFLPVAAASMRPKDTSDQSRGMP
ncbi:caspase family protein [Ferrovibrio sp.]|uniref:caspase family protein n=1 Tax=Ferrovibrio sp. TaxID=1917215 RepID=UPI0025C63B89|nr:caspase family protein [Ferrovibrio sp.]